MIAPQLSNQYVPVQILDNDTFNVLFNSANPMRLSVIDEKRATRFKVEDGSERSDHVVTNAIEISIELILTGFDARQQFQEIHQAYSEQRLVIVQSKMRTYENMLIEACPHEETQEIFDGVLIPIRLVEWRGVQAEFGELQQQELRQSQVASPEQSSTVKRGTQTGQTVEEGSDTERRGSTLSRWGLI